MADRISASSPRRELAAVLIDGAEQGTRQECRQSGGGRRRGDEDDDADDDDRVGSRLSKHKQQRMPLMVSADAAYSSSSSSSYYYSLTTLLALDCLAVCGRSRCNLIAGSEPRQGVAAGVLC